VNVLVTGAAGMLARAACAVLDTRGHDSVPLDRIALDVTDAAAVTAAVDRVRPDAVVHCAAFTAVDAAESDEAQAFAVNAAATAALARACRRHGARLVYPSTDYVFDGAAETPYRPDSPTSPLNAYGRSKLAGEEAALTGCDALVVRTSWLYGPGGRNFVTTILDRARAGETLRVVDDQLGAPTTTRDLARVLILLLELGAPSGIYHATNEGETTWYGLARAAAGLAGIPADIRPCSTAEFPRPAVRPAYSVLDCSATWSVTGPAPHWRDALARSLAEGLHD
jgi:dTDP-4-dehydrorhamnose reductase